MDKQRVTPWLTHQPQAITPIKTGAHCEEYNKLKLEVNKWFHL